MEQDHDDPVADVLGRWIASFDLSGDPLGPALTERAKLHFLDAIGVALGGTTSEDGFAESLRAVVDAYESAPAAQLIGRPGRAAPALAAFHNGSLIHSIEFDDTFSERTVHTESVVVAAALAVGEATGATGEELVRAWSVGTETMLRLASAVDATFALNESGFHTTSVFGTYGAAATAATLLGLDAETTANALALCTSLASGTNAGWGIGSARNKCIQPGWAAFAGINAAQLAAHGVECARTTIESELGLYYSHAWKSTWSRPRLVAGLGDEWTSLTGTFKFHVAGDMLQATLDCAVELAARDDVRLDDVEAIRVVVPHRFRVLRDRPGFFDAVEAPGSALAATASWPYSIAVALVNGRFGVQELRRSVVQAPAVRTLAGRIEFVFGDEDDAVPSTDQPTEIQVVTRHGTWSARRVRHTGYSADFDRIAAKFGSITAAMLPDAASKGIVDCVRELESTDARELAGSIAEAGRHL